MTIGPAEALAMLHRLPQGTYLLTAAYDTKRAGQLVHWVQPCATEPLLVCVAALKGHIIDPLIRDSHAFALCQIDREDKLVMRKFMAHRPPDDHGDPFDSIEVERLVTGAAALKRSPMVLDCEVVRHFDLEADHELYIGLIVGGRAHPSRS